MKKFFLSFLLLLLACPVSASDSEQCRIVSEATWGRFGYKVDVICEQDRVDLFLREAPVMQEPKDLARFIGHICGWGRALDREHHMDHRTRMVITIEDKSMETTVGNCVRAVTNEEYREFFIDLVRSWK